jgi:catechol 2,3-dioxygenase-like lactoylglutathione lyase family enzyme
MTGADDDPVGDLQIGTVVVNVQDVRRGVIFWSAVLGYRQRETDWDPEFMMLVDARGSGVPVALQLTDRRPAEPVRLHLDLYTSERDRHVERIVALGAERVEGWRYPVDADFVVLRDPDGNEFCVIDHA